MNAFEPASTPRPLPRWLPQAAGLLAAAFVAFWVSRWPLFRTLSLGELIGFAVQDVLEVLLASAATVWILCAIQPPSLGLPIRRLVLQTSLDALWLAPFALFIRENSPWAAVIAAVFVASVVKSFRLLPDAGPIGIEESSARTDPKKFSLLESSPAFRRQAAGFGAALCAQTGALAAFGGYPIAAVLLVATGSAVWTWSATKDASPRNRSPRALLIASLALILTAGALIPYLRHSFGTGGFGIPFVTHAAYAPSKADPRGQIDSPGATRRSSGTPSEGDPGIILWPDKLTRTKLVAPAPVLADSLLTSHHFAQPLVIPFDGVYWFFRWPEVHPPRSSREAHGSPELLDIRSTDRRPLFMEAYDNVGSMIALDCCGKIQVAIRNADHYPETVSLELVLINTRLPGTPSQSLGRSMVESTRPWRLYRARSEPVNETLNFAIPAKSSLHRFDEVRMIFRIDAARADVGPKIAIDHLVLVPRGL